MTSTSGLNKFFTAHNAQTGLIRALAACASEV